MHVPSNVPLGAWIRSLLRDRREYVFYKTDEWRTLRREVMDDHGWTCEMCAERGEYSRAQTVHHEYEVRDYPSMALTRWVEQPDGTRREVLHCLCNGCHNAVHDRAKGRAKTRKNRFTNDERW